MVLLYAQDHMFGDGLEAAARAVHQPELST